MNSKLEISKIEFTNAHWEETSVYYFIAKSKVSQKEFLDQVSFNEGFDHTHWMQTEVDILSLNDFMQEKGDVDEQIISSYMIEEQWDYKVYFLETTHHYIVKIWETAA